VVPHCEYVSLPTVWVLVRLMTYLSSSQVPKLATRGVETLSAARNRQMLVA
jgi:hypothetical protein